MTNNLINKLKLFDAQIASGKTTQIARAAVQDANAGVTVLVAAPTHAACAEVDKFVIQNEKLAPRSLYVHLLGRRPETCIPEKFADEVSCSSCPPYATWITGAEAADKRVEIQQRLVGRKFDLVELQKEATRRQMCPRVLSRVLAAAPTEAGIPTVVTAPHSYLYAYPASRVLEHVCPQRIYVDEGDTLGEMMICYHLHEMQMAGFRSNRNRPHTRCMPGDCKHCRLHYSDTLEMGQISPSRRLMGPKEAVSNPRHFTETLRNTIEFVKEEIADGKIRNDIFNLNALEENLTRIEIVTSVYSPPAGGEPSWKTLAGLRAELRAKAAQWSWAQVDELPTEDADAEDQKAECAFGINFNRGITDAGRQAMASGNEDDDIYSEEEGVDYVPGRKIPVRAVIAEDVGSSMYQSGTKKEELRLFLRFVEFCEAAGGKVYLLINPKVDENESGKQFRYWQSTCELSLLALDAEGFHRTIHILRQARSKLLSGSFLDSKQAATLFLLDEKDIEYKNLKNQFHQAALILVHNHRQGELLPDSAPRPLRLTDRDVLKLIEKVSTQLPEADLRTLCFMGNTGEALKFFHSIAKDETLRWLRIENHAGPFLNMSSPSAQEREQEHLATLVIDKLRAPSARAANRQYFDICVVHADGYPNWSRFVPVVMAASQRSGKPPDLASFISYNRQRAVIQALLRVPRSAKPAVCLYIGDMPIWDFPEDLRNRIVTTSQMILQDPSRFKDYSTVEGQLDLLAGAIVKFLLGETAQCVKEETDETDSAEVRLAEEWCRLHGYGHPNAAKFAYMRIRRVKAITREKGSLDRSRDRIGSRRSWPMFVDFLWRRGILKPAPANHEPGRAGIFVEDNSLLGMEAKT